MIKNILLTTVIAGCLFLLFSCSNTSVTEQAKAYTELPPTPTPTIIEASGIHLNADGSGDYPDLVKAIEAAKPGDTIILGAGTYRLNETLKITESITLIGAGMDKTNIVSSSGGAVLYFTESGIYVLDGITVEHEGTLSGDTVVVENGEIDFSDCRFTGATGTAEESSAGLVIRGITTGEVKNCQADNNLNTGILITEDATITLDGNTCENNRGVGIAFRENAGGTVRNNSFNKNDFAGFYVDGSGMGELRLETNDCSENGAEGSSGGGIMIKGQADPTLKGNTCNSNIHAGIAYGGSAKGSAVDNDCSHNGFAGIYLEGEAEPSLEGNTCNNNGTNELGAGIAYFNNTKGTAKGNTVKENKRDGIFVGNEAAPELLENISNQNMFGIHYLEAPGGSARKNQCTFNEQVGILVDTNSKPLLEENSCSNNRFGIYIVETANPKLVENDLHDNLDANLKDLRP